MVKKYCDDGSTDITSMSGPEFDEWCNAQTTECIPAIQQPVGNPYSSREIFTKALENISELQEKNR